MILRALLAASLLLPGASVADDGRAEAVKSLRASLAHIQQLVAKARDERHPIKLTCAAKAEDEVINLFDEARASREPGKMISAARRSEELDLAVLVCQTQDHKSVDGGEESRVTTASSEQPLIPTPPDVYFYPLPR